MTALDNPSITATSARYQRRLEIGQASLHGKTDGRPGRQSVAFGALSVYFPDDDGIVKG